MLKNKYQRLNKEERKKAKEDFYKTEFGKSKKAIFNRILIYSILIILYGIILTIVGLIKHSSIWNYIAVILLFTCAFVLLIGRYKIIVRDVNNYLIKNKK